jgi:hypothetical protein
MTRADEKTGEGGTGFFVRGILFALFRCAISFAVFCLRFLIAEVLAMRAARATGEAIE